MYQLAQFWGKFWAKWKFSTWTNFGSNFGKFWKIYPLIIWKANFAFYKGSQEADFVTHVGGTSLLQSFCTEYPPPHGLLIWA